MFKLQKEMKIVVPNLSMIRAAIGRHCLHLLGTERAAQEKVVLKEVVTGSGVFRLSVRREKEYNKLFLNCAINGGCDVV